MSFLHQFVLFSQSPMSATTAHRLIYRTHRYAFLLARRSAVSSLLIERFFERSLWGAPSTGKPPMAFENSCFLSKKSKIPKDGGEQNTANLFSFHISTVILCHWFPNMFDFHPTLFVGRQRVSIDLYLIDSVEATV